MSSRPDISLITAALRILFEPAQVVELRALGQYTASGYYDDLNRLAADTVQLSNNLKFDGIYWTIQALNPALLARSANAYRERAKAATSDPDVIRFFWLPVDCDPVRPSDISSTDAEKALALEVAQRVSKFFADLGCDSLLGDSGNGYHVLVRIELPASDAGLVKKVLEALAQKFDTDTVKIDRKLFNPARILKAYGTVARKGSDTAERPHRISRLISNERPGTVLARSVLEQLASEVKEEPKKRKGPKAAADFVTVMEDFLTMGGINHGGRMAYKDGHKWQLDHCPFNPEHRSPDVIVTVTSAGAMGFLCSHNSCADYRWAEFRTYVEERIGHRFVFKDTIELDEMVAHFNSRFFVIEDFGNKCRVAWLEPERHPDLKGRLKLGVQSFDDFRKRFMHQKIQIGKDLVDKGWAWLDHPQRRQYKEVAFGPGKELGPEVLNLWKGFAVEPRKGDCHLFLEHLQEVVCAGHELTHNYLIKWLARGVQLPGERAHTAIVVRGEKGVGKNFFADTYGELFGSHCITVANAEHIVGRFNDHLRTCVVLIGNEAFFAGNKQHEAVLKTLVTDTVLTIERKYVDIVSAPNLLHLILLSNSDWVVPASADERRFLMLDASNVHKSDMSYFRALANERENGGRAALLDFLLKLDISRFEPRSVPKTAALWQQMSESLAGVEAAWFECLHSGEIPAEVDKDGCAMLRSTSFIKWAGERNARWKNITDEQVGHLLGDNPRRRDRCMGFKRAEVTIAGERRKVRIIPTLRECRYLWNMKRFGVPWDDVRDNWTSCAGWSMLF